MMSRRKIPLMLLIHNIIIGTTAASDTIQYSSKLLPGLTKTKGIKQQQQQLPGLAKMKGIKQQQQQQQVKQHNQESSPTAAQEEEEEDPILQRRKTKVFDLQKKEKEKKRNLPSDKDDAMAARDLIVGGTLAEAGEFPWFVASTTGGFCGASLIAPSVVLTACHCAALFAVGAVVLVGAMEHNVVAEGSQARLVAQAVPHPLYNNETLNYDFLLLQLGEPVADVEPLAWNKDPALPVGGTPVTVMGFGRTAFETGDTSDVLLKLDLEIFPDDQCLVRFGSNNLDITTMLCAMTPATATEPTSACQGDSGGPLVMMVNEVPLQVGIVSWGIACASEYYPGIYARPTGVLEWMETTICELSPECSGVNVTTPSTPAADAFTLTIVFRYDEFPEETTWGLIRVFSDGTETLIAAGPPLDDPPAAYSRWRYSPSEALEAGTYRFGVWDSHGDGLQEGTGYQIYVSTAMTSADGVLVAEGPLEPFTAEYFSVVFDVPPADLIPSTATQSTETQPDTQPGTPMPTSPSTAPLSTAPPTMTPITVTATTAASPATASTTTTTKPSGQQPKEPCVCLDGPQVCRREFCAAAEDRGACHNLGCTWLVESDGGTKPPNVEIPPTNPATGTDDGGNGGGEAGAGEEEDEMTNKEKAGISLLVGLGVAVVLFVVVAMLMYIRRGRKGGAAAATTPRVEEAGGGAAAAATRSRVEEAVVVLPPSSRIPIEQARGFPTEQARDYPAASAAFAPGRSRGGGSVTATSTTYDSALDTAEAGNLTSSRPPRSRQSNRSILHTV